MIVWLQGLGGVLVETRFLGFVDPLDRLEEASCPLMWIGFRPFDCYVTGEQLGVLQLLPDCWTPRL